MKPLLALFLILFQLSLSSLSPPIWPQTFSQDLIQGTPKVKEAGKLWYDFKNGRQRFDSTGSNFDYDCYRLGQDLTAKCSLVLVNKSGYVNLPEKSKCCKICENCQMPPSNWLQDYTFVGEATLSGQSFNKWTDRSIENYYETIDSERIPRRLDGSDDSFSIDFIMNTFSKDKIQDSVFKLGSNCETRCPREQQQSGNLVKQDTKSLSQFLFRKIPQTIMEN